MECEILFSSVFALLVTTASLLVEGRRALAEFDMNGISGSLFFREVRPANATLSSFIEMDSRTVRGIMVKGPFSWHVHEHAFAYTVSPRSRCGSTGGHYDPHGRGSSPSYKRVCRPSNPGRFDNCEVGDMSGKFGPLQPGMYRDDSKNMTLAELVGRSVVLHIISGERWACANIVEIADVANAANVHAAECRKKITGSSETKTLVAHFGSPVAGSIYVRQLQSRTRLPVTVFSAELWWTKGAMKPAYSTTGLNWTIHLGNTNPNLASAACGSGHLYAPMTVGRFRVATAPLAIGKTHLFAVDRLLTPVDRLIHREILLRDPTTHELVACAKLKFVQPLVAEATLPGQVGTVAMTQDSVFDNTRVKVDFSQLANIVSQYQIMDVHRPGTPGLASPDCTAALRASVYNPFGIIQQVRIGTTDMFPTGDLSSKYGRLHGHFQYRQVFCDSNLPLMGRFSVLGKPLVLLRSGRSLEPYTCASIVEKLPRNPKMFQAIAYIRGALAGHIQLSQVKYPGGNLGDTFIDMSAFRNKQRNVPSPAGQGMPTYKFHVHSGRIGVRSSLKSICDEMFTGPHYNPFNVTIDLAYHAKCSPLQPRRCELGDTAGKVGLLQNLSAPQQKIDPMLPLQGPNSVIGRSFVIHGPFGNPQRIACGNILPPNSKDTYVIFRSSEDRGVDMRQFRYTVALRLVISVNEIVYEDAFSFGRCTVVTFVLVGVNSRQQALDVRHVNLDQFTHSPECETALVADPHSLFETPNVVEWIPAWIPPPVYSRGTRQLSQLLSPVMCLVILAVLMT